MARAPDPRIEQAKELYLAGEKLIEIAKLLELPEGTVRRWKCTHKWDKAESERSDKKIDKKSERSDKKVKRKRGAQPGNKKAVTTGEFETLLFDCMDEDEKRLIANIPEDKQRLMLQEIGLSSVRERRMLKRIEAVKQSIGYMDDRTLDDGTTLVSIEDGEQGVKKKYGGKLGQIQAIEEALTRVQAQKQRAIESLHKFGFNDAQIRLETKRIEMAAKANGEGEEDEILDDGFLDALKGISDWKDWRQEDEEKKANI